MSDRNPERSTTGLRPKRPKLTSTQQLDQRSGVVKSNIFDIYCDYILPWKLEQTAADAFNNTDPLPLTYETADKYIEHWEPLLVEEIKCGIINKVMSARWNGSQCKPIRMSRASESVKGISNIKIDCSVIYDVPASSYTIK